MWPTATCIVYVMISREQVSYGGSRLMLRFVKIVTRMEIRIGIQKNRVWSHCPFMNQNLGVSLS